LKKELSRIGADAGLRLVQVLQLQPGRARAWDRLSFWKLDITSLLV